MTKPSLREARFYPGWQNALAAPPLFSEESENGAADMPPPSPSSFNAPDETMMMPPPPPPPPLTMDRHSPSVSAMTVTPPPSYHRRPRSSSFKTGGGSIINATPPPSPGQQQQQKEPWKTVLFTTPSPSNNTAVTSALTVTPMSSNGSTVSTPLLATAQVFVPKTATFTPNNSSSSSSNSRPHRTHPYQDTAAATIPSYHHPSPPPPPPSSPHHLVASTSPSNTIISGGGGSSQHYKQRQRRQPYTSTPPPTNTKQQQQSHHHRYSPTKRRQGGAGHSNYKFSPVHKSSSTFSSPDNNNHKKKIKTELCVHYMEQGAGKCPWGDACTYAHGEAELQHQTLRQMQAKGLLDDVENYRTKPCFAFVSMGSCPFGRRCVCIHDPRVAGKVASWLPLTETQGNNIETDINVEGLHQKRHHAILAGNPFGEQFSIELDDWTDLYKLVTNTSGSLKRRRNTISEVHKLSMAIQMRQSHEWMYKFCPQHVIFQETCMVLQQKAFALESDSGNAVPMTLNKYKASNPKHVMVYELAFGPDADPSVRGVALWFNIPKKDISECNSHQAKRYRWKKTSKFDDANDRKKKVSPFELRECFNMVRPHDQKAFDLCTEILEHRFATAKAERLTNMGNRFQLLKELKGQRSLLQDKFECQKRDWIAWTYPINHGRQRFDEDSPVPPVDVEYKPMIDATPADESQSTVAGSAVQGVWGSFVATLQQGDSETDSQTGSGSKVQPDVVGLRKSFGYGERLSIFVRLGEGEKVSSDRSLPHITASVVKKQRFRGLKASEYTQQSERCWKSLLLVNKNTKNGNNAEWDIVKDHFQNFSRTKKVLNMIQQ